MCPRLSDRGRTHSCATDTAIETGGYSRQQDPQTSTTVGLIQNRRIIAHSHHRMKSSTHLRIIALTH